MLLIEIIFYRCSSKYVMSRSLAPSYTVARDPKIHACEFEKGGRIKGYKKNKERARDPRGMRMR